MNPTSKIHTQGHRGMAGSAIKRNLEIKGYHNRMTRTHSELDRTNQQEVNNFFKAEKPEYIFLAATKVGGIMANITHPVEFIYENAMIGANVIHVAYTYGVAKLPFLGSSRIYPKLAPQSLKKEYLPTGELGVTNEAYAVAKIAVMRMCKHYNPQYGMNFITVMPTNLYVPNDNYDYERSHIMAALTRDYQQHFIKKGIIKLAQECSFEVESIKIITPTHWLVYQINHLMSYLKQGKTSVFWSCSDKKSSYLKVIFGITGLMDRLNPMIPIARLLNVFKIGESYVAVS